jgi:brefeldin A-resistance guanine nucleotide exchange factor 1
MHASGALLPPPLKGDDERPEEMQKRWSLTEERLEQFLPGFLRDLVPADAPAEPQAPPTPAQDSGPSPEEQTAPAS